MPCPAAQASAVSKPKPATGKGRPNSEYCLRKLVIWLPARLKIDQVGLGAADLEQVGAEVGGVGRHQVVAADCAAIVGP